MYSGDTLDLTEDDDAQDDDAGKFEKDKNDILENVCLVYAKDAWWG